MAETPKKLEVYGSFRGPQGPQGAQGDPGYTPVKGVDYFTDADKSEMAEAALDLIPEVSSGSIVKSGSTITVTTPLSNGNIVVSEIALDENGYPSAIVIDGVECPVTVEGFETETQQPSDGDSSGGSGFTLPVVELETQIEEYTLFSDSDTEKIKAQCNKSPLFIVRFIPKSINAQEMRPINLISSGYCEYEDGTHTIVFNFGADEFLCLYTYNDQPAEAEIRSSGSWW